MINMVEIEKAINELESGPTNYAVCDKLASLYTVRHFYHLDEEKETKNVEPEKTEVKNEVVVEYRDILPSYRQYTEVKKRHALGEVSEENVLKTMQMLGKEIIEFLTSLYASTESIAEREILVNHLNEFTATHNK